MKFIGILLGIAFCVVSYGQSGGAPRQVPDTSTPISTVHAFLDAVNAKDIRAIGALVEDVKRSDEMVDIWEKGGPQEHLEGSDFQVVQTGPDAVVIYILKESFNGRDVVAEDMVRLHLTDNGWRLSAPKAKYGTTRAGLSMYAYAASNPHLVLSAAASANRASCGQNIRQLGLGMIMYSGDYDDVMKVAPSQSAVKEAILPYIKNRRLWNCPSGAKDAYSFNVKLAGISFVAVVAPQATVLFYEGHKGTLDLRHEGKAWVCFCDGHVQLIDAEQAKGLRWTAK